ncbi:MAG: ABC transporter permease, partial [Gammaproteobacteria bacterium]|nr:ABC transporter permease [Gammaproteobacteria bacterium]
IYNQDSGPNSIELIQRLAAAKAFQHVIMLHNIHELRETLDNQRALVAITFPNNFSAHIKAGIPADLQLAFDGRKSNATQITASYIEDIVNQYQTDEKLTPTTTTFIVRNWFNPNLDYKWFIVSSLLATVTTIGALVVTAMSVAREREQGTLDQLFVSPLTPGYLMIGKLVPALVIVALQVAIILVVGIFLYGIPFQGSLLLLYFCLIFYGLALGGVGLMISSVCSTQQQAFLGVFGFMMVFFVLSGYVSPIENIPEPLQSFTWFNPVRHFMVISRGIYLKNLDFGLVWPNLWPLIVIAAMTNTMAYWVFKKY